MYACRLGVKFDDVFKYKLNFIIDDTSSLTSIALNHKIVIMASLLSPLVIVILQVCVCSALCTYVYVFADLLNNSFLQR